MTMRAIHRDSGIAYVSITVYIGLYSRILYRSFCDNRSEKA